jgi:hypothetical protein
MTRERVEEEMKGWFGKAAHRTSWGQRHMWQEWARAAPWCKLCLSEVNSYLEAKILFGEETRGGRTQSVW